MPKYPIPLFIATLCFASLPFTPPATSSPNFILILTDDQSYVGTSHPIIPNHPETASDYFKTLHIERLAALGMTFSQGYAPAASCCPTRRAIQTGQTPARHEYNADRQNWTDTYRKQLNIPRMLQAANPSYQTAHFGKWDHRYDEITPEDQGFDASDGYTGNGEGGAKGTGGPAAQADPKRIDSITDRALDFIDSHHENQTPFFLQISHYAVHLDIFYHQTTLEALRERPPGQKHNMPEFAAMTEDMDTGIGRVLDKLAALDLLKNTYVIYFSDNGGRTSIPKAPERTKDRNAPLRDGKHSFYEGGIRVPFIIAGPGVAPGSHSDVPVTGLDIFPTLAQLVAYPDPLPNNIDGGSLTPLLHNNGTGTVARPRPYLIFHQAADRDPISAIRLNDFKLVKTYNRKKNKLELFDLSADLSEKHDLSSENKAKTKELNNLLKEFLKEVNADLPPSS
ncbi:MAG: sulfatase-like hydrolase/transferase [Verrucomicrobiota bacterium]